MTLSTLSLQQTKPNENRKIWKKKKKKREETQTSTIEKGKLNLVFSPLEKKYMDLLDFMQTTRLATSPRRKTAKNLVYSRKNWKILTVTVNRVKKT